MAVLLVPILDWAIAEVTSGWLPVQHLLKE